MIRSWIGRVSLAASLVGVHVPGVVAQETTWTRDGRRKRDPVFVDEGRGVVYAVQAEAPRLVLVRLDRKTRQVARLFPKANLPELKAVFSRDGRSRAWLRMTGNDQLALLFQAAGDGEERIIKTAKSVAWSPTISPDGRQIVFNLAGQLVAYDVVSGRSRELAKSGGRSDWPAFSPDGRRVAFGSSRGGDVELYIVGIDGSGLRRLTTRRGLDMRPSWSPDGRWLAFTSVRSGNYEIAVMPSSGGEPVLVTRHQERDDFVTWHPSGRSLLWVAEREGRHDLRETGVPAVVRSPRR